MAESLRQILNRLRATSLCLASTATLHTWKGVQLWLQRLAHPGRLTTGPSLPTVVRLRAKRSNPPLASKERCLSTKSVLPRHGVLAWNRATQLSRYRVGEPSLSGEPECLSLHRSILTEQEKNGNAQPFPPK
jgi:hypothetical protein